MEDGRITDAQLSSTGVNSIHCSHNNGRLNADHAWCPSSGYQLGSIYIQIDLGSVKKVTQIATQGRAGTGQLVKTFSLSFSMDDSNWTDYTGDGQCTIVRRIIDIKFLVLIDWLTD